MGGINYGAYENSKKSPYNLEFYDGSWELEYMKELKMMKMWLNGQKIMVSEFHISPLITNSKPIILIS